MKLSNKYVSSTIQSAIVTQEVQLPSTTIHHDQNQKCLKLHLRRPINCPSQKSITFVGKLVKCLTSNKYFLGTAALEEMEGVRQKQQGGKSDRFVRQFKICYQYAQYLGMEEKEQVMEGRLREFAIRCDIIHAKIEQINIKYRIENRVNYWVHVLEKEIERQFVGGMKVEEVGERVIDQTFKLFDSN